jgi:hypothetical protein
MGWGLKIGLFLVALIAVDFSAWIITVPILLLLFLPPLLDRKGGGKVAQKDVFGGGKGTSALSVVGGILVLLSVFAFFSGGMFSPVVLGGCGLALLLRKRVSFQLPTGVRPVKESILLRHRLAPYRWSAFAEAKVSTRDLEGALSGLNERLIFTSDPRPRILVCFSTRSLSRVKAEDALTRRIQDTARALVPLGVYLLPLDSADAAGISSLHASRIEPPTSNARQNITTADYGSVIAEAQHGFVKRLEMYSRLDEDAKATSVLSPIKNVDTSQMTLRELLHGVRDKVGAPQPDRYGAFLSSMAATQGEALGQRITETVQGGQEQVLLVASVGNPSVELSRAQLRAISKIYE